ncbi:keto-deoxy-phosphogluconate aldolase [Massilia sp. H-1]|nr:keto-deoxy-phosphogluconate aldolase [Massilia sp. H-1]
MLEVTLRTRHGLGAIRAMSQVPGAIVGVGTLTQPEEFAASRDAGAVFGVSPGLTATLIEAARKSGLPLLPGVMTPSEVMAAREGASASSSCSRQVQRGGVGMLNAIGGPLPDVTFCPTGGISIETAPKFLACKNVACVGVPGSRRRTRLPSHDWAHITELARAAAALRG